MADQVYHSWTAKHANPHSAPKDGDDTVPKRLQIHTDDEAYNLFLEDNMEKVKAIMKNKCNRVREKHTSDSDYARRVNQRLDRIENSFPSKTWFLTKKPRQTKVNYEHTTGLCKDCHMSQVNHDTLLRYARMYCHCGTDSARIGSASVTLLMSVHVIQYVAVMTASPVR